MALTYGTDGIKQKDYRVYVEKTAGSGVIAAVTTYLGLKNKANLNALIATLDELGECRADSIDLGIADGDSIEGNVLGKIVLSKTGTFTAELINATPANIAGLEALDGNACTILMVERDIHGGGFKTCILMHNFNLSYSEKATGGDSIRSTINIEKSVPDASSFRSIADVDFK